MGFLDSYKVTSAEIAQNKVQSAPDTLTGTPQDNKRVFDKLAELIANKLNAVIEKLAQDTDTLSNKVGDTSYSITDTELKSLYGNTATMKSILQALGRKTLYNNSTGFVVGSTRTMDLSGYSQIEVTYKINENTVLSTVYEVGSTMTGGNTYHATGSVSLVVIAMKLSYSNGKLTYDSCLGRIIRDTAVVNYATTPNIIKIVGIV